MAERTGLEPATSGVTGQHSNQLNYRSTFKTATDGAWWVLRVSNPRPPVCKTGALPLSYPRGTLKLYPTKGHYP